MFKFKFISFEGITGTGKSTQSKMLYQYLKNKGKKVILTREVGGSDFGEAVRTLFLQTKAFTFNIAEFFLILGARYDHLHKIIFPALLNDYIVICDRFIDSTIAYHECENLQFDQILKLHEDFLKLNINDLKTLKGEKYKPYLVKKYSNKILLPDITLLLHLEHEVAFKRAKVRDLKNNYPKGQAYYNLPLIEKNFSILEKKFQDRIVRVSCLNKNEEEIHTQILKILNIN